MRGPEGEGAGFPLPYCGRLDRDILVKEPVFKSELRCHMLAQRLNPIALGCMMACRDECDAGLLRHMHVVLRYFAGEEGVHPQRNRLLEIALGRAAAPCDALDGFARFADDSGLVVQAGADMLRQLRKSLRPGERPVHGEVLLSKTPLLDKTEALRQLRVVAEFGVRV